MTGIVDHPDDMNSFNSCTWKEYIQCQGTMTSATCTCCFFSPQCMHFVAKYIIIMWQTNVDVPFHPVFQSHYCVQSTLNVSLNLREGWDSNVLCKCSS